MPESRLEFDALKSADVTAYAKLIYELQNNGCQFSTTFECGALIIIIKE